jgi:TonB family protein
MTTSKSGPEQVGLTGPVVNLGGTAGHLPAGYAVREFQIDRVLGEGGFSVVYLATDTRLERQVAIKEYMPTALATRNNDLSVHVRSSAQHREAFEAGLRSFINEAKLLARFEHRALVKVHQFWQEKGTAYMVMPYYSGPTLKSWIRQQHEPVDATWLEQFLRLVMDALETLHRENCLHRDVAPDNILILNERSPLLLDFGAARRVIGDLTQALTVILKPGFAPIEQYAESQSMRQGPWTDVYALCAVAHFMITGRAPTPSVTRVLADDLVPLGTVAAGRFPPAFLAALDAGLTVRPQQRPQSIAALRELMNGTAPEDNTLTAPPGVGVPVLSEPVTTAFEPVSTTIRPLTPTIAPDAVPVDDDKTRIVTARDFPPLRTSPATISSPEQPALAAAEDSTSAPAESDPTFGTRLPSRSMQEHVPAAAEAVATTISRPQGDDDKASLLPLVIGGVAIALVVGGAWALINWMNGDMDQSRKAPAVIVPVPAPAPAPAPAMKATAPEPKAAEPAPPVQTAAVTAAPAPAVIPEPAPAAQPAPAVAASTATPVAVTPQSLHPPAASPAATSAPPAVAGKRGADKPGPSATPASAATASAAPNTKSNPPDKGGTGSAGTNAAGANAAAPAYSPAPSGKAESSSPSKPTAPTQMAANTAPPPNAASKGGPVSPSDTRAQGATIASPSKSGAPSNSDIARARPTAATPTPAMPAPMSEPPVAPPVSVPSVATVDAMPPAPVAAVEPPRSPAPPPPASTAPLRAVSKPDPMFPREALRADVDKGRVRARLYIASDGTVSKVEILSAQPMRVFDREVRETAMRWRYDPPGQPRQTEIEFVFDRSKDR